MTKISDLMPELPGGLEKVDTETGQCTIRHPITGQLRIVSYPPAQAVLINEWFLNRKLPGAPLIQDALDFLSAGQREELISGLTGAEFDAAFKED